MWGLQLGLLLKDLGLHRASDDLPFFNNSPRVGEDDGSKPSAQVMDFWTIEMLLIIHNEHSFLDGSSDECTDPG